MTITYLIMFMILAFLGITLLFGATTQKDSSSDHFFNLSNTKALRGFWCLIVVLVHIPGNWQNPIQDLIGSFAQIGVTFFFMTSAYALRLKTLKKENSTNFFWRKRVLKLIVPCFLVNIILYIFNSVHISRPSVFSLLMINEWVINLLICYLIFACIYKMFYQKCTRTMFDIILCISIFVFSLLSYFFQNTLPIHTWPTESLGFAWGILLASNRSEFIRLTNKKWPVKCILLFLVALTLELLYMNVKTTFFWGGYLTRSALALTIVLFMLTVNTKISFSNKISHFLGEISYEIYLSHTLCFSLVGSFTTMDSGPFILASILCTVLLSSVIHYIAKKILGLINRKSLHLQHKNNNASIQERK